MKKIILISILALLLAGCEKQEPKHYRIVSARYFVKEYDNVEKDHLRSTEEHPRYKTVHYEKEYIEVVAENNGEYIKEKQFVDYVEIGTRNEVIEDWGRDIYLTAENYKKVLKDGLIEIEEE